jgi:hypothetical protein
MYCGGGHLGFQICIKNIYFVYLALSSKENKINIKSIKSSTVGKAQKSIKEKSNRESH